MSVAAAGIAEDNEECLDDWTRSIEDFHIKGQEWLLWGKGLRFLQSALLTRVQQLLSW